jgi:hypothetical protein
VAIGSPPTQRLSKPLAPGFVAPKDKKERPKASCGQYLFITYVETSTGIKGSDRYREAGRGFELEDPYSFSPTEQLKVNAGNAYGGALAPPHPASYRSTVWGSTTAAADAIDVDTAGSDLAPYDHQLITLIVASDRVDFTGALPASPTDTIVGGIMWEWHVDAAGRITGNAVQAGPTAMAKVRTSLYPPYSTGFLNP